MDGTITRSGNSTLILDYRSPDFTIIIERVAGAGFNRLYAHHLLRTVSTRTILQVRRLSDEIVADLRENVYVLNDERNRQLPRYLRLLNFEHVGIVWDGAHSLHHLFVKKYKEQTINGKYIRRGFDKADN